MLWLLGGLALFSASRAISADAEYASLRIEGLEDGPLLVNVRNTLPPLQLGCDAPAVRFVTYVRNAEERARTALRALGHFNPRIESAVERDAAACPEVVMRIESGPPTRIEAVDIVIDGPFEHETSAQRFFENLRLRVGDTLNQGDYDRARDDLINRARARGYLDARYSRRVLRVDTENNQAFVELTLQSGERYRFGTISAGQDILRPELITRLMPVAPGDPYSSDGLAGISSNLAASGYFSDVRVRPDIDRREDGEIPVDVLLTPRKRTGYEFRVGYGTDTGARLRADVDRRWMNRRGHTWRSGVGLSQRIQSLDTVYSIPMRDPLTDKLDFFARISREDNNNIVSDAGTLGAQLSRTRNGWTQAVFSEYLFERSEYGGAGRQSSNFLLGGIRLGHRELDDPLFPTRGHSFNVKLQGAAEPLLSSTSLMQAHVKGALAWPLGRMILKGRGEFGSTWVGTFRELPKSLRFFAGGDNSVRGYGYESLGPRNANDQVVGGRHVLVVSGEAMMPVAGENVFGAIFVDSGNAFDSFKDMDLKTGAGVGVRYRSPIGMVRVDVAVPFNASSRSPRLHLGIGAEF